MSDVLGILSLRSSGQTGRLESLTCKCALNDMEIWVVLSCIIETAAWASAPSNKGSILFGSARSFWLTSMLESNSSNALTTTQYWLDGSSAKRTFRISSLWCSSRKAWNIAIYSFSSRRTAWDISLLSLERDHNDLLIRSMTIDITSSHFHASPKSNKFPAKTLRMPINQPSLSRGFGTPGNKTRPSRHLWIAELWLTSKHGFIVRFSSSPLNGRSNVMWNECQIDSWGLQHCKVVKICTRNSGTVRFKWLITKTKPLLLAWSFLRP